MQKMCRLMLSAIAATGLLATSAVFAQSSNNSVSFSFAPPPIASVVEPGDTAHRVNVTYLKVETDDPLTAVGADYVGRKAFQGGRAGLAFTGRGMGLGSDSGNLSGFLFGGGIGPEFYFGAQRNTILFLGGSFDYMYLYADMGMAEADIYTMMLGLQVALQHHMALGDNVTFIPYVAVSANSSSTTVDTYIPGYGTTSTTTDSSSNSTTIGFDLKLRGISLGALANTGGDNNVKMFRIGFNF